MNLASLTSTDIRKILSLLEKKEAIHADLAKVSAQIAELEEQKSKVVAKEPIKVAVKVKTKIVPVTAKKPAKAGRKGGVKDQVLDVLKKAGSKGIHISDIAKNLKMKEQNIRVWFSTAGKKSDIIHKVKPGVYRLKRIG